MTSWDAILWSMRRGLRGRAAAEVGGAAVAASGVEEAEAEGAVGVGEAGAVAEIVIAAIAEAEAGIAAGRHVRELDELDLWRGSEFRSPFSQQFSLFPDGLPKAQPVA
jgi:hypothetical protein